MAGVAATKNLQRVHGRGLLLSTLEKDILLTEVRVFPDGRFIIGTKLWDEYWQPVHALDHEKMEEGLNKLRFAWNDYVHSGFDVSLRQDFCCHYFTLLDILLSLREELKAQEWISLLQRVLGFECFGIASAIDDKVLAAGICTIRNPCYLLSKLKIPTALDDPQFFPVITIPDIEEPDLFYHYRQYTMSCHSPMSLLLYLAVSEKARSASFKLISSFVGGVRGGIDPRTVERARRLYQSIIRPLIESNSQNGASFNLELADIGAGSGSLSAAVCREIQNTGVTPKLRLWFVDLEPADPARFFRTERLKHLTDNLNFIGDDYRNWLTQPQPLPAKNGLRIALVSKLFNNLSNFSIRCLSGEQLYPFLENENGYSNPEKSRPSICLAASGAGIESLAISNTRVQLQEGRTFSQASLSAFYQGLYYLSGKADSDEFPLDHLYLPVRSFNPECLVASNGMSVISCLAESCDYIIIEDADLRPQDLIDHVNRYSLGSLTICSMTKAQKLKGNYLYVIWKRNAIKPQLSGEQIW